MAHIKVYTSNYCGYCNAAKNLLKAKELDFEEINVEGNNQLRQWLIQVTGQRTLPQIFIDDKSIGGFKELSELNAKGKLG